MEKLEIDAEDYLPSDAIQGFDSEREKHARDKDRLVTYLAVFVISWAALISGIGLLIPGLGIDYGYFGETLRLAVVASLSFVMGQNSVS